MTVDEYNRALKELGVNDSPMCPAVIGGVPAGYHRMRGRDVLIFVGEKLTSEQRQAQIDELMTLAEADEDQARAATKGEAENVKD